eukprot:1831791-Rhodomonas_salina.1
MSGTDIAAMHCPRMVRSRGAECPARKACAGTTLPYAIREIAVSFYAMRIWCYVIVALRSGMVLLGGSAPAVD